MDNSSGERRVIERGELVTVSSIVADLRALGVQEGSTCIVHASLSRLGWVAGGAHAVVLALRAALGSEGTIVMPTHTTHLTDPSSWEAPPVPESWWPIIRAEMPAYDPECTPSQAMGAIVECFRTVPGVLRSAHPKVSFAALGPNARTIVDDHALDEAIGERSPLGRCYVLDAQVLLLGVGYGNNTSLHLAESRASYPAKRSFVEGAPMIVDGVRRWVTYDYQQGHTDDFEALGAAFAATDAERTGPVGAAVSRLMSQRALVDFAVAWMTVHRA